MYARMGVTCQIFWIKGRGGSWREEGEDVGVAGTGDDLLAVSGRGHRDWATDEPQAVANMITFSS
jgi:hypothetical protein